MSCRTARLRGGRSFRDVSTFAGLVHDVPGRAELDGGRRVKGMEGRMADAERVTARQRAILTAIIESYIETGEPVGSGTIARL